MGKRIRIQYNAPVTLTFALVSLVVLLLGQISGGRITQMFFCVYRAPLSDPLTYVRLVGHVLGHADYAHFIGNMTLFLVIGPPLEEKYGSRRLLAAIAVTALVSGLVQICFFPSVALLGASGIVFMMVILSSLAGMREGAIPLSLILVAMIYLGGELVDAITVRDNISQMTHIVGGICGAALGFGMQKSPVKPPL